MHFLRDSATSGPDTLIGAPLDPTAAGELETAHRRLLHLHLEKELKSARVLRQLR
jgi:hypothetical protein